MSENIHRRHMTKGQQAMAVAVMYPESQQGKKGTSLIIKEVNDGYLSQARFINKHQPKLVNKIFNETITLSRAYTEAKDEVKKDSEGDGAKLEMYLKRRQVLMQHL